MWTADRPARSRLSSSRGFTALELMVTLVILMLMALVVERTMGSTTEAQRFLKAIAMSTERSHTVGYEIRENVSASRRLFFEDDGGRDYLDALELGGVDPLAGTRLPRVDEGSQLYPDLPGDPRTGNLLFFATESDAVPCISDPSAGTIRHVDVYRFVLIYPHRTARFVVTEAAKVPAVDLVVWKSVEFPNYRQITGITDADERAEVLAELADKYGYDVAWDPEGPIETSFYNFGGIGTISSTPDPNAMIPEDPDETTRGRLVYKNCQLAPTDAANYHRRAVFSVDDPATWRPEGFEVKVVGASGSRLVWVHLVVETEATRGQVAVHASSLTASVRDL